VSVIDAYSRYIVHWELLSTMRASEVELVIQAALEKTGATPQIVTDNGSQFTVAEFKSLVRRFAFAHSRIRTYHPESNGVIERFHRSTREALSESDLRNLGQAREQIGTCVEHYNDTRLHAALGYLPPAECYHGDPVARQRERQVKLERALERRREANRERQRAAA
jgi:transposase InsO family protein